MGTNPYSCGPRRKMSHVPVTHSAQGEAEAKEAGAIPVMQVLLSRPVGVKTIKQKQMSQTW